MPFEFVLPSLSLTVTDYATSTAVKVLTAVGALVSAGQLYRFWNFLWLYFLRPSSVHRYIYGPAPYALITGASDGIGKEVAKELYRRGFNLILHGRSEAKVRRVVEEIKETGSRDIKYFLASAEDPNVNFEKLLAPYKGLNITLLVNNVGGGRDRPNRIDAHSEEDLLGDIRVNSLFTFYLTRALLPQLRAASGPSLVTFVGSLAADIHVPRLYNYAPSKAFLWQLTRCLNTDERWWTPSRVSFMYLAVGEVHTNTQRAPINFLRPSASRFAKSVVASLGCGRERITPYAPHAFQQWFMGFLGEKVIENFAANMMKEYLAQDSSK